MLGQHLELDPAVGRLLDLLRPGDEHVARERVRGRNPARHGEHGLRRRGGRAGDERKRGGEQGERAKGVHGCLRCGSRPAKSVSFPARRSRSVCLHRRRGRPARAPAAFLVNPERHDIAPTAARLRRSRRDGPADGVAPRRRRPRDDAVRHRARPRRRRRRDARRRARRRARRPSSPRAATSSSRWCRTARSCSRSSQATTACCAASGQERCCSTPRRRSPGSPKRPGALLARRRRRDGRRAGLGRGVGREGGRARLHVRRRGGRHRARPAAARASWARRCSISARSARATR